MRNRVGFVPLLLIAAGIGLFAAGNQVAARRPPAESPLSVSLPVPLQLLYTGGDRFLAANVGAWRAVMVGTGKLPLETLQALARVQEDVSWLNPWHEDNYYTATAVLPWGGAVDATQTILARATEARRNDVYPPFYYGFNQLYFRADLAGAVDSLLLAAAHATDDDERQALTVMAARWSETNDDTTAAIEALRVMAARTKDAALANYLGLRRQRLETLLLVQEAARRFQSRHGRAATQIAELKTGGFLTELPEDPLGGGYLIRGGKPVLLPATR